MKRDKIFAYHDIIWLKAPNDDSRKAEMRTCQLPIKNFGNY